MLTEGAVLSVYHEPTSGMTFLVIKRSRFDLEPVTVPLPAHMVAAMYAPVLQGMVNQMAGTMPHPGLVAVLEMGIGPVPVPT